MMVDDRVVILGGRGMLGTDVAQTCRQCRFDVSVLDLPEFDITNEKQLGRVVGDAGIIINCAAYTNVEKAESEYDLAYKINAAAVGRLGELAKANGKWILHISTDFVFDGQLPRPYVETDAPNAINAYGKTKLSGERLLSETGCEHCILRLEWTYGPAGVNFVTKLLQRAKQGGAMKVVDDQIGSPTATAVVAGVVCELLRKKPEGIFHFAAAGFCSRFEMAKFIFDKLNLSVDLTKCRTSDYITAAARPLNSRFDCAKIQAMLAEPIENWQVPLARFLEQLQL